MGAASSVRFLPYSKPPSSCDHPCHPSSLQASPLAGLQHSDPTPAQGLCTCCSPSLEGSVPRLRAGSCCHLLPLLTAVPPSPHGLTWLLYLPLHPHLARPPSSLWSSPTEHTSSLVCLFFLSCSRWWVASVKVPSDPHLLGFMPLCNSLPLSNLFLVSATWPPWGRSLP